MENLTVWLRFLGISLLVITGCAGKFPFQISPPSQGIAVAEKVFFKGTLQNTEGQAVDLALLKGQPLVVIFAQDTCTVCREETEEFQNSLIDKSHDPSKVKLVTILVGASIEDALDWKQMNSVPWTVAVDAGDSVFSQYCGGAKVPCTLVQLPKDGIIHRKVGANTSTEIKALTGDWEK